MLSHICLRFKTEGLKQQETLNDLPKATRSTIAHFLFFPIIQRAHLFQGVSYDFLFQLVLELQAEYFPPKGEVMLQNEAPTDLYIIVSGSVDLVAKIDGKEQVYGSAEAGEVFGEIGVLCNRPQPFTIRTRELSQILRLNWKSLKIIIQKNMNDGIIMMENLQQQFMELQIFGFGDSHNLGLILKEWLDGNPIGVTNCSQQGRIPRIQEDSHSLQCYESRNGNLEDHRIDIMGTETINNIKYQKLRTEGYNFLGPRFANISKKITSNSCSDLVDDKALISTNKRVTIHMRCASQEWIGKLIILPDSLKELLKIGGKKFGARHPLKVVNGENAEIDDISTVRDGDHLFLHERDDDVTGSDLTSVVDIKTYKAATKSYTSLAQCIMASGPTTG